MLHMQHHFLCNISYVVIAESMGKCLKYTIKYSYGAARAFLKLTGHADRLREYTTGRGKPMETMLLLIVSVHQPEPRARRGPEQEVSKQGIII